MSAWKIVEEKNVDKAIQKALELYKIEESKIKYEILSHGSSGIFGLVGVKKAKIKVYAPENRKRNIEPKTDQNENPRDLAKKKVEAFAAEIEGLQDSVVEKQENPLDESAQFGKDTIETIIKNFDADYKVRYNTKKGRIHYRIDGKEVGLLIGKRGKTIEALQYLTEKILYQREGKRIPINLEVEKYLQRKEAKIQDIAAKLARKVKSEGKPASLGKLNAKERKIVHLFLKKDHAVRTQSIGDGYMKKLMIFPNKKDSKPARKNKPSE